MKNSVRIKICILAIFLVLVGGLSGGCKIWTNPASLADNISPNSQDAKNPQVAMNASGHGLVVWEQSDGLNSQIYRVDFVNGAWTKTMLTAHISPEGGNAYFPRVAINDNGDAVIVWVQYDGANYRIYMSERKNWIWTNPLYLSDSISPPGTDANYPRVVMNNSGDAVIVWQQSDGSAYQVFKSERVNGSWLHPGTALDNVSPDGQNAYYPVVAMGETGEAIIAWEQYDGANWQIFKSERRNGIWAKPLSLGDNISPNSEDAYYPQTAMNGSGEAIITWEQNDGYKSQIYMSMFSNGVWDHPADLTDNISPDAGNAYYPQVAMNDNGNAVLTWEQELDSGIVRIYKSERRSKVWTHPMNIADSLSLATTSAWLPQVAIDSQGNSIIVWYQYDSQNVTTRKFQVFKSVYRTVIPGLPTQQIMQWSIPQALTDNISPDKQDAIVPQVSMSDSDTAVIVWQQSDSTYTQIFKSEYYEVLNTSGS
jgi:hypothetical protein